VKLCPMFLTATNGSAVAIHDVEPATFRRCALIRDWLGAHGIDRATMLVSSARDLHPFSEGSREFAAWLLDCRSRGDSVVHSTTVRGSMGRESRALRPALSLRGASLAPDELPPRAPLIGEVLRLDIHPADFDRPAEVLALAAVLRRDGRRAAVTYDDLLAA
jgi:hypothetical protein